MTMPHMAVVDVETTSNSLTGFKSSPYDVKNSSLLYGWTSIPAGGYAELTPVGAVSLKDNADGFVFHNGPFDMQWMASDTMNPPRLIFRDKLVLDTSLIEYQLSGMTKRFPGLDETCRERGLPVKFGNIGEMILRYGSMEKIPHTVLRQYNEQDCKITAALFEAQMKELHGYGPKAMKLAVMDGGASVAVAEMQYFGVMVNKPLLEALMKQWSDKATLADNTARAVFDAWHYASGSKLPKPEVNFNSNKFLSRLFFGGQVEVEETVVVGTFKNGREKTKKVTTVKECDWSLKQPASLSAVGTSGEYSVNEEVLKKLADPSRTTTSLGASTATAIATKVLELRRYHKLANTFGAGVLSNLDQVNVLHPTYNLTSTATGRLSSTHPNFQNLDDEIKKVFMSRFVGGKLVEVDFKQLEIVFLALITGDSQLTYDIKNGVDIHNALFRAIHGRDLKDGERKPWKRRTFQLIYGAGPNAIAKLCGITVPEAREFVKTFYTRYPGVRIWHGWMEEQAKMYGTPTSKVHPSGQLQKQWDYISPFTGRLIRFLDEDAFSYSIGKPSFPPTKLKNYPVQSLATGDFIKYVLWQTVKAIDFKIGSVLLVGSVHDSLVFDVISETQLPKIKEFLDTLFKSFCKYFDISTELDVSYNVKIGDDLFNMEELKV